MVPQLKPTPGRCEPIAEYRSAAEYVLGARPAAAAARRQRREGRRPPRDHPDRHRPRRRGVHARRAARVRPGGAALPRRLPSAGALRAHDGDHARRGGAVPHARQDHARGRVARACTGSSRTTSASRRTRRKAARSRALQEGQTVRCIAAEIEDKMTRPPPRYTEATLLSAMETAGKLIDDEELRDAMKESGPRHARDARRDDRDADPPRVHRARRQGPPGDAEGHPGGHDARGAQAHVTGAHRRLGAQARRHRARPAATARRS